MAEFFGRNMDYLFFVYGLLFILMAALCRSLSSEDASPLSWRWMGCFGLFNGLAKWLEVLAFSQGDNPTLRIWQVAFLSISLMSLTEFGRRAFLRNGHPAVGAWLVPGLSALAALGALDDGIAGLNAGVRYALGIPGSILTMAALISLMHPEKDIWKRRGLILSASCICFFGISEIVVPPAHFAPAFWLNNESFFNALGFPAQLLRVFGMAGAIIGFWIYRHRLPQETPNRSRNAPWSAPLIFTSLLVLGWYATEHRGSNKDAEQRDHLMEQASALAKAINPEDVKTLTFSKEDLTSPIFERLRSQFIAMSRVLPCRGIYATAIRNGRLVHGPNTDGEHEHAASPPGSLCRKAHPEVTPLFERKEPFTLGPDHDHPDHFLSAHAPICDPRTGEVLMHIGIDGSPQKWQENIARARLLPIAEVMILLLTLLIGIDIIRRRDRFASEHQGVRRYMESILMAFCGVALTLMGSLLIHESEIRRRNSIFDRLAESRAGQIRDELTAIRADLASLSRFFESSEAVTPSEFSTFAGTMAQADAVEAFAWVPLVTTSTKDEVTAEAHRLGITDFSIWDAPEPGKRSLAGGRPRYFPFFYVEPVAEQANALGFDLGSEAIPRRAMETALRTDLWTATPAFVLNHQPQFLPAVLAFHPVYIMLPSGSGKPHHPGAARGFATAIIRFQNLFLRASSRAGLGERFLNLDLVDLTDSATAQLMASWPPKNVPRKDSGLSKLNQLSLFNLHPVFAFGRTYVVLSYPSPAFLSAYPLHGRKWAITGGLLLTGILTLFVGFLRNRLVITEQIVHLRTAALRDSEENLAVTLNSIGDGVIAVNNQCRIRQMNPAAERLTGWMFSDAFDKPLSDVFRVINSRSHQPIDNPVDRVIASGTILGLPNHTSLITRDGQERQISDSIAPIRDASGTATGVVLVFSDISEKYSALIRLEESEQQYRLLAEHASDVISRLSPDGVFIYASPSCRTMLGYDPLEMVGQSTSKFVHPDDLSMLTASVNQVLGQDGIGKFTCRFLHKNGSVVWVESTGKRVMDPIRNMPLELIAISRDITERKFAEDTRLEIERQLLHFQKLESLGVLAGGIAHDFNNLLTAILSNLELAQMDMPEHITSRSNVDHAIQATKRAADLTRQMLAYSGKGLFEVRDLNMNDLVEENAHMLKAAISKTITLNLTLDAALPNLRADPGQIQQIVMNLITNASEAIGDKVGTITISTGAQEYTEADLKTSLIPEKRAAGRFVWLEVSDTGCGMTSDVARRVFEPFFTTKFTGRGLGMSTVLGIVRGHNGTIFMKSRPNQGTLIRVLFPISASPIPLDISSASALTATENASLSANPSPHAADMTAASSILILVVDDEQIVRDICANILRRLGYRTLTAQDGEEGVQVFREHAAEIALVILDLTMPRMDGVSAFREMRQVRPDVRVILSSGHAEQSALRHFEGQGIAGFLQKPYTLNKLLAELDRVLKGRVT